MKIDSERAREIQSYLKKGDGAEVGKWPIEISGVKQILPFYRLPWALLRYNANNGRLAMERRKWEEENKRKLDTALREDGTILREMLLDLDGDKTALLSEDLR